MTIQSNDVIQIDSGNIGELSRLVLIASDAPNTGLLVRSCRGLTALLLWASLVHIGGGGVRAEPASARVLPTTIASEVRSEFAIVDSKAWVEADNLGKRIFWVSDEEVLFVGYGTLGRATEGHAAEIGDYQMSIWNVRSNAVRVLHEFAEGGPYPCFSEGHLLVRVRAQGQLQSYYGDKDSIRKMATNREFHEMFCRPVQDVPVLPRWTRERDVVWLQKVDAGFVDFGERAKGTEHGPVRFHRHGSSEREGILLPVGRRDIRRSFPYYAFKDAFFVESTYLHLPRPEGVPYPVYWLYRDGRLEKILDLPWGPWRSRGSSWPVPTKRGIVIISHNANPRNAADLRYAGLYLVTSGSVKKILTGWIQATAVSPNGCWLAFDVADRISRRANVLKAVDLCRGTQG